MMNVTCPHCSTVFRVDPAKVPAGGARARCSRCAGIFAVAPAEVAAPVVEVAPAPAEAVAPSPAPEPEPEPEPEPLPALAGATAAAPAPSAPPPAVPSPPAFGVADPASRARRLARALVSDIVVYYPERRERSIREGTLRHEFREEIRKSWEEYTAQVGDEMARGTPYFREALNDILAGGEPLF